jgi:hypothetical protein
LITTPVDISGKLEAVEISGRIVLQAIDPTVTRFQVFAASNNPAFTELGLQSSVASTVFLTGVDIASIPTGTATFGIEVDNDGTIKTIDIDFAGSNTVNDIVNDINTELATEGLAAKIVASRSGNRIVLAAVDASVDVFRIEDGTNTSKLGLADAQLTDVQQDGVFLSQVAGVFVIGANFLDPTVNPDATVDSAFGRLSAPQTFDVSINDALSVTVTVPALGTEVNTELSDLIVQINTALTTAGLGTQIVAVQLTASQIGLRAINESVTKIEITSSAPELGLLNGQSADGPLRVAAAKPAPFYFGPSDDATFTLNYTDGTGSHTQDVTLFSNQTLTNRFIYELVADMNLALNNAFGSAALNPFAADFDGNRLVIKAKASSTVSAFDISAATGESAVTDLKLSDFVLDVGVTQNVVADGADLLIYTQDGAAHRVTLDDATTIQHVIDAIQAATETAPGSADVVTADLNSLHTGLDLTDHTTAAPVPPVFRVESVNASRAVFALGIQAADNNSLLSSASIGSNEVDSVINGDEVATLDLEDRLFVRQIDADTPFLTALVHMHVFLDSADTLPEQEEESAAYGFVGIELDSVGTDILEFNVAIELNKDGDPLNNVTLAELVDAVNKDVNGDGVLDVYDLNQVLTFPTMTEDITLDELVFDVALQDEVAMASIITLGATPQITLDIDSAGDPFHMVPGTAPFDPDVAVDIILNTITLTAHGFETGDKVSYRDFEADDLSGASIGGLVDKQSYYVYVVPGGDDTIQLSKTLAGALHEDASGDPAPIVVDLTSVGTGTGTAHQLLRFDPIDPVIQVHESDLGDLSNFAEIEFDNVLLALQQLRDFLNEFADLGFLGDEIPVLGISFNDLIDVAGRFSDAVDDVTNNPAGTIQQLTQKLRESFGLPPGASLIDLELVDDLDTEGTADSNDMLKVTLDLSRAFTEVLMIDLALTDVDGDPISIPVFGEISLLGQAGLGAAVELIAKLSVGIDLDDDDGVGAADAMGEVFLFTHVDDTSIKFMLDATSTDVTFNASLWPLGVAIIGGDGKFDLDVGFENASAALDARVSLSDIGAAFDEFEASLTGSQYQPAGHFPTPSDFVGDVEFVASLDLIGTDLHLDITTFNVPTTFSTPVSSRTSAY